MLTFLFKSRYISPLGTKSPGLPDYTENPSLVFHWPPQASWLNCEAPRRSAWALLSILMEPDEAQGPEDAQSNPACGMEMCTGPWGEKREQAEGRGEVPGPSAEVALSLSS